MKKSVAQQKAEELGLDIDTKGLTIYEKKDGYSILIRVRNNGKVISKTISMDGLDLKDLLQISACVRDFMNENHIKVDDIDVNLCLTDEQLQKVEKFKKEKEEENSYTFEAWDKSKRNYIRSVIKKTGAVVEPKNMFADSKDPQEILISFPKKKLSFVVKKEDFNGNTKAMLYFAAAIRNYIRDHSKLPDQSTIKKYMNWAKAARKKLEEKKITKKPEKKETLKKLNIEEIDITSVDEEFLKNQPHKKEEEEENDEHMLKDVKDLELPKEEKKSSFLGYIAKLFGFKNG